MDVMFHLKQHFLNIREQVEIESSHLLESFLYEIDFENLRHTDKIIQLYDNIYKLSKEIDALTKPEYATYCRDESWLFNCFIHRFLIYNQDDSQNLRQGGIIGNFRCKLYDISKKLLDNYPKYTYKDFLNEKEDILFNHFRSKSPNTTFDDYLNIMTWLVKQQFKITEHERLLMQATFRKYCQGKNHISEAKKEKELFVKISSLNVETPVDEFLNLFKKFIALRDYDFDSIDKIEWVAHFISFDKVRLIFSSLNSKPLNVLIEKYNSGLFNVPLSRQPIIFCSLHRYIDWIDSLIEGKITLENDCIVDYNDLIQTAKVNGTEKAMIYINTFRNKYCDNQISNEEYIEVLYTNADELRIALNKLKRQRYFVHLNDHEKLASLFLTLSNMESNIINETEILEEAFELDSKINFIINELDNTVGFVNIDFKYDKKPLNTLSEWEFILNAINFETDLRQKYNYIYDRFFAEHEYKRHPGLFIISNLHEGISEILNEAFSRLQKVLDNQHQNKKIIYIQDKLKCLRQRELNSKLNNCEVGNYHLFFKELLEIQAEYIKETKDVNISLGLKELKALPTLKLFPSVKQLLPSKKQLSFGYKEKSQTLLIRLFTNLTNKVDFIDIEKTSIADLVSALTSKDLADIDTKIYFGCETVQLSYIIEKMSIYFKTFNPATIEKSKLFYTKNGILLKASNLYKNKIPSPKEQQIIDKIFRELQT